MSVVSKKKAEIRRKMAQERYEKVGPSAVYTMANRLGMTYKPCKPCEAETPNLQTIDTSECLICGSEHE